MTILCDYCGLPAKLVTGREIYAHRVDLASKNFWNCSPCGAWVGCHPGTLNPLGRLADTALRAAKQRAHAAFDPIWQKECAGTGFKGRARRSAYAWLADAMGMKPEDCHVGKLDVAECDRVVELCRVRIIDEAAA